MWLLHEGVGGPIVEAEAYDEQEEACHAFRGRTRRNQSLFLAAGHAYVYRIHQSFCVNVVAREAGRGAGVLLRALLPRAGRERIAARRGARPEREWTNGPGKLCQALALDLGHDGLDLRAPGPLRLERRGPPPPASEVLSGPRVGISKAQELPWRLRWLPAS